MKLVLLEPFKTLWKDKNPFVEVEKLQGEVYRELSGRKTLRTQLHNKGYFVKIHRGIGWREIFKNLFTAKMPVLGAGQEFKAIDKLKSEGIDTMTAVAFAEKGLNPAKQYSFIITEELAPTISLEDFSLNWPHEPPPTKLKWALIKRVAQMVGTMHRAGVNHRDCYICHFLLHTDRVITPEAFKLSVIDLHRAQLHKKLPIRWRNKDLAALYFSVLEIGLTKRDLLRFLKIYFQASLHDIFMTERSLLKTLEVKAEKLYLRKQKYGEAI